MEKVSLVFLICLAAVLAGAQANQPPQAEPPKPAPQAEPRSPAPPETAAKLAAVVPAGAPVITVEKLCPPAKLPATGKPCRTVITRAEFESLANAVRPNLPPHQRRLLAENYIQMLSMAYAGQRAGIEQDPKVREQLRMARLQVLAGAYSRRLQQEVTKPSAAEVERYYKENAAQYEEITARRVYIPRTAAPAPAAGAAPLSQQDLLKLLDAHKLLKTEVSMVRLARLVRERGTDFQLSEESEKQLRAAGAEDALVAALRRGAEKGLDEAGIKALAEKIRERAAAGEDMDKLAQEAWKAVSPEARGNAPTTILGPRRRGSLPPGHEAQVFELKVGDVSPVFEEPSGLFIYKIEARRTAPLEEVKDELAQSLESQKVRDTMEGLLRAHTPVLNEAYFAAPSAAGTPPPPAPPQAGRPPRPPAPPKPPAPQTE